MHSKSDILELCNSVNASHRYHHATIGSSDGYETHEIGCVEGRDFWDLIQQDIISSNLMDYISYSQFPSSQTQVTYISSEVSNAIITCDLMLDNLALMMFYMIL